VKMVEESKIITNCGKSSSGEGHVETMMGG
jgi:hypothetical protein